MITSMMGRMANAEKLSIPQLQQAIKNGTIPAYVGVPLLQEKMRQQQQMQMAAAQQQQGMAAERPPIAEEIMAQAGAMGGVDQLPSNLPIQNEEDDENYAGGGIIAFSGGRTSDVRDPDTRSPTDRGLDELIARINSSANNNIVIPPAANTGIAGVAPEVFSVDGVSPEFGGSSITADQDAERIAKIQAERTAAEDAQRQAFLRTAAPQMVRPEAPAPERTVDTGMFSGVDSTGPDVMPPKAPSQGAVSPATARQISATNPGAPATLKDAERQAANGSPQASAAVSMLDKYVAMLEKSGDDVGRQKKEALYMALIQGGLGMMGGTSPNAFANISAGLLPATQAYQQAIAGIRKDDRQRLEKLMAAGISKEKLILEAEKLGIERTKATAMANYYNARAGAAGAGSSKEDRLADQFAEKTGLDYDRAAQVARRNMTTALANNSDYNSAKQRLAFAKNLKPAEKAALEKTVRDAEAPYLEDIAYNRSMAQRYLSRSSRGGGDAPVAGNMPKGIPQGSKQVGTSGGKPVYESPDGKRYIVE